MTPTFAAFTLFFVNIVLQYTYSDRRWRRRRMIDSTTFRKHESKCGIMGFLFSSIVSKTNAENRSVWKIFIRNQLYDHPQSWFFNLSTFLILFVPHSFFYQIPHDTSESPWVASLCLQTLAMMNALLEQKNITAIPTTNEKRRCWWGGRSHQNREIGKRNVRKFGGRDCRWCYSYLTFFPLLRMLY